MEKGPITGISTEDILHYQDLARQFTKKSLLPIFEGEFPDGNLSLLPEILDTAFKIGIAASPDTSMPGNQYGIWGAATDDVGPMPSLMLLSIVAETCGGTAMCLHAQGVASNLVLQAKSEQPHVPLRVGLCLQEGFAPPYFGTILSPDKDDPAHVTTTAAKNKSGYAITGHKSFVYSMDNVNAYVVFAQIDKGWGCFLVPATDRGVSTNDAGVRTGLRACVLRHVDFNSVEVPKEARLDHGDARDLLIRALCMNWAGMSAVAVGIAKGAAVAARKYAAERYQGGVQIEEHPAVQILIAGSEAAIAASESTVASIQECDFTSLRSLKNSASAKLAVMDLCSRAVTDCLQSFGGYGYMEDFGMEKRLRDVTTLKSASGSPVYLKQLIFNVEKESSK